MFEYWQAQGIMANCNTAGFGKLPLRTWSSLIGLIGHERKSFREHFAPIQPFLIHGMCSTMSHGMKLH